MTHVGLPVSKLLAECVREGLTNTILSTIKPELGAVVIKRSEIGKSETVTEDLFRGIEFTMEGKKEKELAFLDVVVRTDNGLLITSVYWKQTNANQILKLHSDHPKNHDLSCIKMLFIDLEHIATT